MVKLIWVVVLGAQVLRVLREVEVLVFLAAAVRQDLVLAQEMLVVLMEAVVAVALAQEVQLVRQEL
jgi:hypothetical protein